MSASGANEYKCISGGFCLDVDESSSPGQAAEMYVNVVLYMSIYASMKTSHQPLIIPAIIQVCQTVRLHVYLYLVSTTSHDKVPIASIVPIDSAERLWRTAKVLHNFQVLR